MFFFFFSSCSKKYEYLCAQYINTVVVVAAATTATTDCVDERGLIVTLFFFFSLLLVRAVCVFLFVVAVPLPRLLRLVNRWGGGGNECAVFRKKQNGKWVCFSVFFRVFFFCRPWPSFSCLCKTPLPQCFRVVPPLDKIGGNSENIGQYFQVFPSQNGSTVRSSSSERAQWEYGIRHHRLRGWGRNCLSSRICFFFPFVGTCS